VREWLEKAIVTAGTCPAFIAPGMSAAHRRAPMFRNQAVCELSHAVWPPTYSVQLTMRDFPQTGDAIVNALPKHHEAVAGADALALGQDEKRVDFSLGQPIF
jgi:hypothetical protein